MADPQIYRKRKQLVGLSYAIQVLGWLMLLFSLIVVETLSVSTLHLNTYVAGIMGAINGAIVILGGILGLKGFKQKKRAYVMAHFQLNIATFFGDLAIIIATAGFYERLPNDMIPLVQGKQANYMKALLIISGANGATAVAHMLCAVVSAAYTCYSWAYPPVPQIALNESMLSILSQLTKANSSATATPPPAYCNGASRGSVSTISVLYPELHPGARPTSPSAPPVQTDGARTNMVELASSATVPKNGNFEA